MAEWVKDLELPLIRDKSCHPREDANWISGLTQQVKDLEQMTVGALI